MDELQLKIPSEFWCYRTRLTADKREITDFPKLPLATSFIRKTSGNMLTICKNQIIVLNTTIRGSHRYIDPIETVLLLRVSITIQATSVSSIRVSFPNLIPE